MTDEKNKNIKIIKNNIEKIRPMNKNKNERLSKRIQKKYDRRTKTKI